MKNIITSIIGLAIALGLILGAVIPIAARGRSSASNTIENIRSIENKITELSNPMWPPEQGQ